MKGVIKIFIPIILCPAQVCYLWVGTQAERIVPVEQTDAKNLKQDEWINLVRNENTKSGWNVDIKKFIPNNISSTNLEIIIQTKGLSDQSYKEVSEFRFCDMLNGYQTYEIVSKDILNMILPGNQGNCNITKGSRPMKASGCLNLDYIENAGFRYPEPPFKMIAEIRFLHKTIYKFESSGGKRIKDEDTLFRVYYDVGKTATSTGENKCIMESTSEPTAETTVAPEKSRVAANI